MSPELAQFFMFLERRMAGTFDGSDEEKVALDVALDAYHWFERSQLEERKKHPTLPDL